MEEQVEQGKRQSANEWALDEQGPMSEPQQHSDEGADEDDQPPEE